jgi:spermidine/putrescine transport system permease protein
MLIFLYVPLVVLVVFAFNNATIPSLPWSGFTTKWFHDAFANADLTGALKRSAWLALLNGLAATLLGVFAAIAVTGRKLFLRSVWTMLILLPLVVPYIVLAIGMVIVLHQLGYQASLTAVLAGHIVISLPYSVLVIVPRLRTLDEAITEAARDLGADVVRAFTLVTLPLLLPALISSTLIAFTISFDEFAIASFLAPPGSPTYPVFLYSGTRTPQLEPQVIAIGALVVVFSLVLVTGSEVIRRVLERRLATGCSAARAESPGDPGLVRIEPWPLGVGEAHGAVVGAPVPAGVKRRYRHHLAGLRRVDETAAADVDADVAEAREEHQVAGPKRGPAHVPAHLPLGVARMGKPDAELGVHPAGETRAIEAGRGGSSPRVRHAALAQGQLHGPVADRRRVHRLHMAGRPHCLCLRPCGCRQQHDGRDN